MPPFTLGGYRIAEEGDPVLQPVPTLKLAPMTDSSRSGEDCGEAWSGAPGDHRKLAGAYLDTSGPGDGWDFEPEIPVGEADCG